MIDAPQGRAGNGNTPSRWDREEIVYGDKVINLVNTEPQPLVEQAPQGLPGEGRRLHRQRRDRHGCRFFWRKGLPDFRWKLEVEFSSQPGFKYDFTSANSARRATPCWNSPTRSRSTSPRAASSARCSCPAEPVPTSLARAALYRPDAPEGPRRHPAPGPRTELRKYSSDDRSETARRLTNLFVAPSPIEIDGRFFEEHLIHRTARGEMVRSKSEVIIADAPRHKGVEYAYERPLTIDGVTKYPDFTIEDMESGLTFYWEHCGMLHVPAIAADGKLAVSDKRHFSAGRRRARTAH